MLVVCVHSPVQLQPPSSKASQPVFGRQCTVLSRARSLQLQRSVHKVGSMHDWSESAVQRPAGLRHPLLRLAAPPHRQRMAMGGTFVRHAAVPAIGLSNYVQRTAQRGCDEHDDGS